MKKNFVAILAVLVVVDLAAMGLWWRHKQKKEPAPTPVEMTPAAPPETRPAPEPVSAGLRSESAPSRMNSGYGMSLFGPGISPGGCETMEDCETYCLKPENEKECLAWTQGDAEKKRKKQESVDAAAMPMPAPPRIAEADFNTPGNCQGKACAAYCRSHENLDECLDYCTDPRYKKKCLQWGVGGALREAMSGALVGTAEVIDSEAFEILQKAERR